jgi:hypothetical protein
MSFTSSAPSSLVHQNRIHNHHQHIHSTNTRIKSRKMNPKTLLQSVNLTRSSRSRSHDRSRSRSRSGSRGRSRDSCIAATSEPLPSSPTTKRPSVITTDISILTPPPSTMPVIRELDSPVSPLSPYSRDNSSDDEARELTSSLMKMSTRGAANMMPIITVTNIHGKTSTHTCFYTDGRNKGGDFYMMCEGCDGE